MASSTARIVATLLVAACAAVSASPAMLWSSQGVLPSEQYHDSEMSVSSLMDALRAASGDGSVQQPAVRVRSAPRITTVFAVQKFSAGDFADATGALSAEPTDLQSMLLSSGGLAAVPHVSYDGAASGMHPARAAELMLPSASHSVFVASDDASDASPTSHHVPLDSVHTALPQLLKQHAASGPVVLVVRMRSLHVPTISRVHQAVSSTSLPFLSALLSAQPSVEEAADAASRAASAKEVASSHHAAVRHLLSHTHAAAGGRSLLSTASLGTTLGNSTSDEAVRATPEVISGLLVGALFAIVLLIGLSCLSGVQTPMTLPVDPPQVGRTY